MVSKLRKQEGTGAFLAGGRSSLLSREPLQQQQQQQQQQQEEASMSGGDQTSSSSRSSKYVVEFFYDVVSPYSYFAFEELLRLQAGEWRDVLSDDSGAAGIVLRPFFLGGVMQAANNKPPLTVPAKGAYMMGLDLPRYAGAMGLRLQLPSRFPALTLVAQRVLTALARHDREARDPQARLRAATRRMWQLYWGGEDGDITNPETLSGALVAAGCSAEEAAQLMAKAQDEEVKAELKATTDEAVQRGAFGAPVLFVRRVGEPKEKAELFFGADRFHHIAAHIGKQWTFPAQKNRL